MTGAIAFLERFDDCVNGADPMRSREQERRAADYAEGYAAGEAAALSRAAEQNEQLRRAATALDQKLTEFDNNAAGLLCDALASAAVKIFPMLAEKGFAHEAAVSLNEIVTAEDKSELVIKTAPNKDENVRVAMTGLDIADRSTVVEDDALSGLTIGAEWNGGGVNFDTEKAISIFVASLEKVAGDLKGQGKK